MHILLDTFLGLHMHQRWFEIVVMPNERMRYNLLECTQQKEWL